MIRETDRRRFLALAGTGTALSLAGCPGLQSDADPSAAQGTDTSTTRGTSTDPAATQETPETETVAVAVQIDQQALRQRQQQIGSEVQAGNITRSEAQEQLQAAETDLRQQAIASFRERATSDESLTINDAVDQFGVLLISGSASSLIGTLSFSSVSALLPEQTFQQAKAQAQQGSGSPTPSN